MDLYKCFVVMCLLVAATFSARAGDATNSPATLTAKASIFSGRHDPPPWRISSSNHIERIRAALSTLRPSDQAFPKKSPYFQRVELTNQGVTGVPSKVCVRRYLVSTETQGKVRWFENSIQLLDALEQTLSKGPWPEPQFGSDGRDVVAYFHRLKKLLEEKEKKPNQGIQPTK